ncbi:MAG: DUF3991 and toprim domain-containing protein [Faecousia sp.]
MGKWIEFTDEERIRARNLDLVSFLRSKGEEVKRCGREYQWIHDGQRVTINGNIWFHQYERVGGDPLSFAKRFFGKQTYPEQMELLLGTKGGQPVSNPKPGRKKTAVEFVLPARHENHDRVAAYLYKRRGLPTSFLQPFFDRGMIYEAADYHNAVFVGFDADGKPRHANLRGIGTNSPFKGNTEGSDPRWSFHWTGSDDTVYLFEAPVDLLSWIWMNPKDWQRHSYAACCGVADPVLWQMLEDNPGIRRVILCLDNDDAGRAAAERIRRKVKAAGYTVSVLVPRFKDWNEDLMAIKNRREGDAGSCPRA